MLNANAKYCVTLTLNNAKPTKPETRIYINSMLTHSHRKQLLSVGTYPHCHIHIEPQILNTLNAKC